jgi:hypothetical protein
MVDTRSIAGSSCPSHHGQGSEQESTFHSRAGRSHRTNAHDATMVVVATAAATHWQHSASTAAVTPPGAGPEGMLQAARELLRNPPGPSAPPLAVEQWRHDVNQLIITANNMPSHGGRRANHSGGAPAPSAVHSHTPTIARAPSAVRTPSVVSHAIASLRVELERHRSGEDNSFTIERCRERRRNLDGDFSAANATPGGQAARTPTSPRSRGGCMALSPQLQIVVWPRKFWPHSPEKYDESVNPTKFL